MKKENRNHFLYVLKELFKSIKNLWAFLLLVVAGGFKTVYVLAFLGIVGVCAVYIILSWFKTKFYIQDGTLVLEKGILSKTKEQIPFGKINTIDFGQGIVERLFKVGTLKIDTGSVSIKKSEVNITVKCELAEEIRKIILSSNKVKDKETEKIKEDDNRSYNEELISKKVITKKEIIKYSFTKSKLGWAIGMFFAAINFVDDIERFMDLKFTKIIDKYVKLNVIKTKSFITIVLASIVVLIFLYMLMVIASMIFEMIRLNDYTVKLFKNKIEISYGLFNKKQYSFKLDKIYGIRYKQNIMQQLTNNSSIELITIGYGDENDEKALLYPIISNKSKENFIKKILPNMIFEGTTTKPPKSSIRRFILIGTLIWSAIVICLYILLKHVPVNIKLPIGAVVILSCILGGFLSYKNTYLGINGNLLIACMGNFNRVTTVIRNDVIQSITKKQSIFQRWGRVCTYKIDLYSTKLGDIIKVKHMQDWLYNKIQENIKF